MYKNNISSTNIAINTDEYFLDYNEEFYDVSLLNNKLYKQKSKKNSDFNDKIQVKNNSRILLARNRDALYALKNRRTVNNDWKQFNNNQM